MNHRAGVLRSHAPVNLNLGRAAQIVQPAAQGPDALEAGRDKLLTAKTRIDTHDQDQVDIGQHGPERFEGRAGIQGDTRFLAQFADLLHCAVQMRGGLHMDRQAVSTSFGKVAQIAFRVLDHQVDVHEQRTGPPGCGQNRQPEADIRHEGAVHHVYMRPVRSLNGLQFLSKTGEVAGQEAWSEFDGVGHGGVGHRLHSTKPGRPAHEPQNMSG
ncbi:hypothetical protein DEDE109153_05420 [Deinococcus deserti]